MKELNEKNFKEEIAKSNLVLVDFYATWCGPCGMQSEVLKNLQNSRGSLNFEIAKVNVDEAPNLSSEYGIDSIPSLLIFKNNEFIKKVVGLRSENEILDMMENV